MPSFEYRLYSTLINYDSGLQLYTDDNNKNIINWPEQNYDNGVKKNNESNRRFKRIVRIMKKLKNEMEESNPY